MLTYYHISVQILNILHVLFNDFGFIEQEIKQGYLAERHAHITSKNLKVLLMGGNESKLATYKLGSPLAIVSLGRKEGVAQLPFTTISGCIPGLIKSGDLFVGKTRKELGLAP